MNVKLVLAICFILSSTTFLCGCVGNSEDIDSSLFVGKWTSDHDNAPYVFGNQVTFNEDGTLTYGSWEYDMSYQISGNKILISHEDGSEGSKTFSFSENNTVLTLTDSAWELTAVYEKQGSSSSGTHTEQEEEISEINIIDSGSGNPFID